MTQVSPGFIQLLAARQSLLYFQCTQRDAQSWVAARGDQRASSAYHGMIGVGQGVRVQGHNSVSHPAIYHQIAFLVTG